MGEAPSSAVRSAVVAYADRWHRTLADGHRVTSPLGAWLVLALAAPATSGTDRDDVEAALGTDAAGAFTAAGALLDATPTAVAAAAAFWCRPDALGAWTPTWPAAVATGPVPVQAAADDWARQHTLGLIDTFPLTLTPQTVFVLCSALATRVRWARPFDLGAPFGDWSGPTLTSAGHPAGRGAVVDTRIGAVALWRASSDDGLDVTSVIADRAVPRAEVLAVAHELATSATTDPHDVVGRRSLFDLALGVTDRWEITETFGPQARAERVSVRMPAWEARSDLDLLADPRTGFDAVGRALAAHTGAPELAAVQTALARYGREGFEAAAVTAIAGRAAAIRHEPGPQRHAQLRFAHPHAVVATSGGRREPDRRGPWFGLPVFAAWVEQAVDATA